MPLSRFPLCPEGQAEISLVVQRTGPDATWTASQQRARRRFLDTEGGDSWSLYDTSTHYGLEWAGVFVFHIARDGAWARCYAGERVCQDLIETYFAGLILPFLLQLRGKIGLHASAVALPQGIVGFLGHSGQGKSTLAAAFAREGYPLLTDDFLLLCERGDGYYAAAGLPQVRLSGDSFDFLSRGTDVAFDACQDYDKLRVSINTTSTAGRPCVASAGRLLGLYILTRDRVRTEATHIEIHPVPTKPGIVELLRHISSVHLLDKGQIKINFAFATSLISRVPVYHLIYPSALERIPQVIAAVLRRHQEPAALPAYGAGPGGHDHSH